MVVDLQLKLIPKRQVTNPLNCRLLGGLTLSVNLMPGLVFVIPYLPGGGSRLVLPEMAQSWIEIGIPVVGD